MYEYDEYNEEEIKKWEKEGGAFLIREGIVKTDSLKEIEAYKNRIEEEEEIKKINNEGRRSFNIVKLKNERSNTMFGDYEMKELIEEFNEEEIEEDIEKELKVLPEILQEALGQAYKILNRYKEDIKELSPDLFGAIGLLGRLAVGKTAGKYPYPGKVKKFSKALPFDSVQRMLFGDINQLGLEKSEIPKPSRENPFPSITKSMEKKLDRIEQIFEYEEEDSDYYDDEDE